MESYLTLLATTRPRTELPTAAAPPTQPYKLSVRRPHRQHHRKWRPVEPVDTDSPRAPQTSCAKQQHEHQRGAHDAFRSGEMLDEVVRLENDASHGTIEPEDALALLQRILKLHGSACAHALQTGGSTLTLTELLDGIDAACWRTLASKPARDRDSISISSEREQNADPPVSPMRETLSPRSCTHASHNVTMTDQSESNVPIASSTPVKLSYAQLYRGVQAAITERHAKRAAVSASLQQTLQRNDAQPATIQARDAELQQLKATQIASSAQALDCDVRHERAHDASNATPPSTSLIAAAVDVKVSTLRRRRDLRVWACNELRDAINDHLTRASDLKKTIAAIVNDIKREELAHMARAKRIEAAMAAASTVSATSNSALAVPELAPDVRVTQAREKRTQLLDVIAQRRAYLRTRTEEVFTIRSERDVLEHTHDIVSAQIHALQHEITHVQRACTPRPNWSELLDAAAVTTAIDRAGKNTKLRIEQTRNRQLGIRNTRSGTGSNANMSDDNDASDEQRLKHLLLSNWSTVDKVQAMATELTRIRTKYHASDALVVEQAKLKHLQREIARTLQQLDAIKAADDT